MYNKQNIFLLSSCGTLYYCGYQTTRSMPQALIGVMLICKGLQIYSIVHWVEAWKQGLPTMYGITKLDQGFEFCWLKKCYDLSCFIQIRSVTNSASIHYCPQQIFPMCCKWKI